VLAKLEPTDPSLAAELQRRWNLRKAINSIHLQRLDMIESLPGFSGIRGSGTRHEMDYERAAEDCVQVEHEIETQLATITDFLVKLSISDH